LSSSRESARTIACTSSGYALIAARHRAHSVAVFGSVAHGKGGFDGDANVHVDVISRGGLKPRDKHIREEALPS
jgi:predicted nucleotidyltransferase